MATQKTIAAVGGRKMVLILVALILIALKDVIGLDEDTVQRILILALGGAGAIAAEDGLKGLLQKK